MQHRPQDLDAQVTQLQQIAREKGIRLTPQRLAIFREVVHRIDHPTAEMIHQSIARTMPTVSLDTVYRTLWMMIDLGALTTLGLRKDSLRFDPNLGPHHHFICRQCGLVRDFTSKSLDDLRVPDIAQSFGQVDGTHVEVHGLCEDCLKDRSND